MVSDGEDKWTCSFYRHLVYYNGLVLIAYIIIIKIYACLGTVLGNEWGIAKKATGIAIRVLNANGYGSNM